MTGHDAEQDGKPRRHTMRRKTYAIRFSLHQRMAHILVMVLFLVLALTGMPQQFFESSWAQWMIAHLGGIDRVRWLHRLCGILFAVAAVEHMAVVVSLALLRRTELSMIPTKKDFTDAILTLQHYLGASEEEAQFDRYDYRQKFEYWGLVFGGMVMVVTGFILYLPTLFTWFLPGELIPAAKVAHSSEGLLAFLIIIVWHIYNAHLNPDVFPFDTSIFTGRVDVERMRHEHPLEYARLVAKGEVPAPEEAPVQAPPPARADDEPS